MATTKQINERWEISVAIGLVILILLLAWLNGAMQGGTSPAPVGGTSSVNPPNTWEPTTSPLGPINILPAPVEQYNIGNGQSCSCGCNNQSSFAGLQSMIDYYNKMLSNTESTFFAQTLAALPSYVQQYVNNLTGWQESLNADKILQ